MVGITQHHFRDGEIQLDLLAIEGRPKDYRPRGHAVQQIVQPGVVVVGIEQSLASGLLEHGQGHGAFRQKAIAIHPGRFKLAQPVKTDHGGLQVKIMAGTGQALGAPKGS